MRTTKPRDEDQRARDAPATRLEPLVFLFFYSILVILITYRYLQKTTPKQHENKRGAQTTKRVSSFRVLGMFIFHILLWLLTRILTENHNQNSTRTKEAPKRRNVFRRLGDFSVLFLLLLIFTTYRKSQQRKQTEEIQREGAGRKRKRRQERKDNGGIGETKGPSTTPVIWALGYVFLKFIRFLS